MATHRPMTRVDLARLMGEPVDLTKAGDNRLAHLKAPATKEELLARFKECAEQVRAIATGDWQGCSIADLEEAMLEMPLTPEDEDETGFDGNGLLNDLAIYVHAYQTIRHELFLRKKEATEGEARAGRAAKRRPKLVAVA